MKVALCCIGRMENLYIKEYVEYYQKLGFDKIFIYDNNHDGEDRFEDVIGDYINAGFVDIVDFRNKTVCQLVAYQDCYDKHGDEYDWICFFDCDEFLTFKDENENVKSFLSQDKFNGFDIIHVNWMCYGDNDLVYYDNRPLTERFTKPVEPLYFKHGYDFPENNHIKSIVRGGLDGIRWTATPHTPNNVLRCCNGCGNECNSKSPFNDYDFSCVWLRHYQMKTIQEWIQIKKVRGVGDRTYDTFIKTYKLESFFKHNKKTKEKERFIQSFSETGKNVDNLDIFICTHKDFKQVVTNPCFKVINTKFINPKDFGLSYGDDFYSELINFYWVVKNYHIKDYIGFCHYRRYFSFMDDIPDMNEIFKDYDAILPYPIKLGCTIKQHYGICHNIEDLEIIQEIINKWFPNYANVANIVLNNSYLFTNNMFIMKKEDFLEFFAFYENVIDRYLKYIGGDIDKRIEENKDKYLKNFQNSPQNGEVWYQKRIGGFLSERLLTIFCIKKFKKIKFYKIELTDKKYNVDKVDSKYEG